MDTQKQEKEIKAMFYTHRCNEGAAGSHGAQSDESPYRRDCVVHHNTPVPEAHKTLLRKLK